MLIAHDPLQWDWADTEGLTRLGLLVTIVPIVKYIVKYPMTPWVSWLDWASIPVKVPVVDQWLGSL